MILLYKNFASILVERNTISAYRKTGENFSPTKQLRFSLLKLYLKSDEKTERSGWKIHFEIRVFDRCYDRVESKGKSRLLGVQVQTGFRHRFTPVQSHIQPSSLRVFLGIKMAGNRECETCTADNFSTREIYSYNTLEKRIRGKKKRLNNRWNGSNRTYTKIFWQVTLFIPSIRFGENTIANLNRDETLWLELRRCYNVYLTFYPIVIHGRYHQHCFPTNILNHNNVICNGGIYICIRIQ